MYTFISIIYLLCSKPKRDRSWYNICRRREYTYIHPCVFILSLTVPTMFNQYIYIWDECMTGGRKRKNEELFSYNIETRLVTEGMHKQKPQLLLPQLMTRRWDDNDVVRQNWVIFFNGKIAHCVYQDRSQLPTFSLIQYS